MCSSTRSVLPPTGKHPHSWRTATGAVWAPAGLARLEATPGQGFALPGIRTPTSPPPPHAPRSPELLHQNALVWVLERSGWEHNALLHGPPPSPHRWVNPKAPKATCLHTKRAVALQRDGRQQPVSFSRHHGQLPASPGVDPAPQASQAGSLVRLHGHAGPWGDSRAVCPPTSLQMQPPKPAALPGGATPSKGFPPLSGP